MNHKTKKIGQEISLLRYKIFEDENDLINFNAICTISGISHSRGQQLAITLMVERFRSLISLDSFDIAKSVSAPPFKQNN